MQVEYVYHGNVLELYSLALLKPTTEHLRVTAARAALFLEPAACTSLGNVTAINASPKKGASRNETPAVAYGFLALGRTLSRLAAATVDLKAILLGM